jgi:peptidoglycan/LPS O-acetylase OafA/YrhL
MTPPADPEHMPQLDGLRAVAVVAVAVSHWTPAFLAGIVPWGTGVQLFFVLSGFLITGILLRTRPADVGLPLGGVLRIFYARRFLRIFPLFYGVIALALILDVGPIRETWPWHAAYLSNWYYGFHGHGDAIADPFLHLWSLSVEEQFYLLWPLVALVAGRRSLFTILVVTIAGSMVSRIAVAHLAPNVVSLRYLTPNCMDALAVGGLVAHVRHYRGDAAVRRAAGWLAGLGFGGLVFSVLPLARMTTSADGHRVGHTFLVIFYGAIVAWAAVGLPGLAGRFLAWSPVRYLGRISYGLYVYHYFAPYVVAKAAPALGGDVLLQSKPALLATYTGFTLIVAAISWHAYELPLNRLKRHFSYPRSRTPAANSTPSPAIANA